MGRVFKRLNASLPPICMAEVAPPLRLSPRAASMTTSKRPCSPPLQRVRGRVLGVRHLLVLPHLHAYPFMLFVHCVGSVWSKPVLALEGDPREC